MHMKAIVYKKYGAPDVLHVAEIEKPQPKDNELLVNVRATEITKSDCELRSFKFPVKWFWLPLRMAFGITKPRRPVLGSYFAGVVDAVGKDVTNFKAGDQIFGNSGLRFGAYGEYVCLPDTNTLAIKPENQSFAQAAAVPLGGLNAIHFMHLANIKPGENVLINGAGGSIGLFAMQIAKDMGAEISVVDSGHKETMLRDLGVVEFFDYTKEDFRQSDRTYDVIFDMVAASSIAGCVHMLKPKGRYLTGNPRIMNMIRCLLTTRFTDKTAKFAFAGETIEELQVLGEMLEANRIVSVVDRVLTMEDAPLAHRLVETEQRLGSIVISITQ